LSERAENAEQLGCEDLLQVNLIVDYSLSKRTDVFALAAFQKAAGDATFASIYYA
jgi:predicted porin